MKPALILTAVVVAVFLYPWIRTLFGRDQED